MFHCPGCNSTLVRCQNEFGNFWHCGECGGTAVTVHLLRGFVDRDTINRLWQKSRSAEYPRIRVCPGCNNPMEAIPVQIPLGERLIDVCDRCHFVWLDAGEWDDLPNAQIATPKADPLHRAPIELRERVAVERLKRQEAELEDLEPGGPKDWWQWIPGLLKFPIEERQPTSGKWPLAMWGLAGLILLISLMAFSDLRAAIEAFGLVPADPLRHGGTTLLLSFFIHGSIMHLLGNLYFLATFGDNVEHFLGPFRFLILLLLATLGGDILHILLDPDSTVPCIGASGGISGVMAYYALQFPKAKISILIYYFYGGWLRLSARWMFALWIGYQFLILWLQAQGVSNVSGAAHLGGVLAGFFFWLLTRDWDRGTRETIQSGHDSALERGAK